ncbi:hypothetical protein HOF65_04040 [bacterium]|nr:hypothetical protein [bacterium]MBT4633399.1 hypothetical protein [bacterium]MBT6778822.1 hypothetical protein [bacterium]
MAKYNRLIRIEEML